MLGSSSELVMRISSVFVVLFAEDGAYYFCRSQTDDRNKLEIEKITVINANNGKSYADKTGNTFSDIQ